MDQVSEKLAIDSEYRGTTFTLLGWVPASFGVVSSLLSLFVVGASYAGTLLYEVVVGHYVTWVHWNIYRGDRIAENVTLSAWACG